MYATSYALKSYVETLHSTVKELSEKFFSEEQSRQLLHNALLPARIICYASTQFGVAFEYFDAPETKIEAVHGYERIEDLFVQAPKSIRDVGPFFNIGGARAEFVDCVLSDKFPFRITKEEASVTFQNTRFESKSRNWNRVVSYAEIYGDHRASMWSLEAAQSRAKDEVLAALFQSQQAEKSNITIGEYVSEFRKKTVLVLGAYDSAGEKRLQSICEVLGTLGYNPILTKDIPDIEHYDLPQKVVAIGAVSRFIVVDDTTPSGHLIEIELCKSNRWVTVILRSGGQSSSWMTAGASISSNVVYEAGYDPRDPSPTILEATTWAEQRLTDLKRNFNDIYPWRLQS